MRNTCHPFHDDPDEETAVRTANPGTHKEVSPDLLFLYSGTKKLCEQQRAYTQRAYTYKHTALRMTEISQHIWFIFFAVI